jgi:hypothetical protein
VTFSATVGAAGLTNIAARRPDGMSIAPATSLRDFDSNVCIAQDAL